LKLWLYAEPFCKPLYFMLELLLLELTNTMILIVEIACSSCWNTENVLENNALSECQTV